MKLVATVQKLTTEALGATELGHMGCFPNKYLVSFDGCFSQGCCFTGHAVFVFQILYSLIVNKSWNLQHCNLAPLLAQT